MFDVGFAELFLLGLIGLLVLGPERLPAVARTLGGILRKARASWAGLRSTIEAELAEADIAKPLQEFGDDIKRLGEQLKPELPDMNSILQPESTSSDEAQADADQGDESKHQETLEKPDDQETLKKPDDQDVPEKTDEPSTNQSSGSNL